MKTTTFSFKRAKRIIVDSHHQFEHHQHTSYKFAKKAGDYLHRVKRRLKHGEWGDWMAANLPFSSETANVYMRISANWESIQRDLSGEKLSINVIQQYLRKEKRAKTSGIAGQLLEALESIKCGLSPKEIIEQSSCFAFNDGRIHAYNGEVYASIPSPIEFTGAVAGKTLFESLKLAGRDIDRIKLVDKELMLVGHKQKTGVWAELKVVLPYDKVETPDKWRKLPDRFSEAVEMVRHTVGVDESEFKYTCVHIHPAWIEASDNLKLSRYSIQTEIKTPTLVRHASLKDFGKLGMNEFSETENWLHFRNAAGLVLSCRRYAESYPNLTKHLEIGGNSLEFPKGLTSQLRRATVFTSEDMDENQVIVELKRGGIRITGQGSAGWHQVWRSTTYDGPRIKFKINPDELNGLLKRYAVVEVTHSRLKAVDSDFTYVIALGEMDE